MEEKTAERKLERIRSFCESRRHTIAIGYITKILKLTKDLSTCSIITLDLIWKIVEKLETNSGRTDLMVCLIHLLGSMLSIGGRSPSGCLLAGEITSLGAYFLQMTFGFVDINQMINQATMKTHDYIKLEIDGMLEELKTIEKLMENIETEDHAEEIMQKMSTNFSITTGTKEIGSLKSCIRTLSSGRKDDLNACLDLLTLFVAISTKRHSVLFKWMKCLPNNEQGEIMVNILFKSIEQEREENRKFLNFFSLPSLEMVRLVAAFDPSEHAELYAYLEDIKVPLQNLKTMIDGQTFYIQQCTDDTSSQSRLTLYLSLICATTCSLEHKHIGVKFKFNSIENKFNVFHIQSDESSKYVQLPTIGPCKLDGSLKKPEAAEWHVIQVHMPMHKRETHNFVFCNRLSPEKILYVQRSRFRLAKGLKDTKTPNRKSVFNVSIYLKEINYPSINERENECFKRNCLQYKGSCQYICI